MEGICIGGINICNLRFADDTALIKLKTFKRTWTSLIK